MASPLLRAARAMHGVHRQAVASHGAHRQALRWNTVMAAVIERSPVLTPDLPDYQQAHFKRREGYIKLQKVYPTQLIEAEEGPDQARARQRVETLLGRYGGRLGAGDTSGEQATLDRKLAQRLYLVLCVDGVWQFPQASWQEEQTAHECVSLEVAKRCGESLKCHPVGNAPMAHLERPDDTKIFFYRLMHVDGVVEPTEGVSDHAWLTKEELLSKLDPATGALTQEMCGPFP